MNLNITNLYKEYEDGKDFDSIVNGAAEVAENALSNKPDFNLEHKGTGFVFHFSRAARVEG